MKSPNEDGSRYDFLNTSEYGEVDEKSDTSPRNLVMIGF